MKKFLPNSDSSNSCTSTADIPDEEQVPVFIYLENPRGDEIERVELLVHALCERLGLDLVIEHPPEIGSWIRKLLFRTKQTATSDLVLAKLQKLERAVELQYLDKPQATVDEAHLRHIAEILAATTEDNVVLQIGMLILVTWHDSQDRRHVLIKTLTSAQISVLKQHNYLYTDAETMFQFLSYLDSDKDGSGGAISPPKPKQPLGPSAE
ncbi:hypothetical protein Pan241w_28330 [Gimesia alba]|uniref:Uncharacterized protein n=1 Tax=Gimesia alba TaxID=2527973 RepID=A0A517RFV0_9PLAN|nr:hypothetical protein [Gimesia alba]QDT42744.1 hypothetical protein Pan241w_28330 [Gimesia alba]